jgi:hypothetical protein
LLLLGWRDKKKYFYLLEGFVESWDDDATLSPVIGGFLYKFNIFNI